MTQELHQKARDLSERPYAEALYEVDRLSDSSIVYVLGNPELENCMAQGSSVQDARKELAEARYEYILSLLEDGLEVPEPAQMTARTGGSMLGTLTNVTVSKTDSEIKVDPL